MKYVSFFAVLLGFVILASCNSGIPREGDKSEAETNLQTNNAAPDSMQILTQRIIEMPGDANALNKRALLYLENRKLNEALRDINNALEISPDNPDYLITLSEIYFGLSQVQKTKQTLLKVMDIDPANTNAMLKMAELNLYFKDYEGVKSYAQRALTIDPNFAQGYFILAFAAKEEGDTLNAVRLFRMAVDKNPRNYEALLQLGIIMAAKKDPLAVEYYKNALDLDPKAIGALFNLALYYQNTEEFNEAIKTYNEIIAIEPRFKLPYYNLGFIHLVYLGVYDEAVKYFSRAIQVDDSYVEAYYNRGYSRELMGDLMNAKQDYQKALKLSPNYSLAVEGLNRIDELEKVDLNSPEGK